MAVLKVLSTDNVLEAFNKYNTTIDEIIVAIDRVGNIITFTKEGGGTIPAVLLTAKKQPITGLEVTNGVNNLNFNVGAGSYVIADELYNYGGGSFTLGNGDATLDRIDTVIINDSEALLVKVGTPAASPAAPSINANEMAVASFLVKAGATTGTSGDVFVNIVNPIVTSGAYQPTSQIGQPVENPVGAENLPDLNDVTLAGLTTNNLLKYDGAKWVNALAKVSELSDVDLTGLGSNFALLWDGAAWVVQDNTFKNLNDTLITGPANGEFLIYTTTGNVWKNTDELQALKFSNQIKFTGVLSPPQITSNQNNYSPTGLDACNILRLDPSAGPARQITGIVAQPDGTVIKVFNVGAGTIRFISNSGSSTAANRFQINGNIDLDSDEGLELFYDGDSSRWRVTAKNI